MIAARKDRLVNFLFTSHARSRIARTFEAVRTFGLKEAQAHAAEAPVLVISNHTSWWDPLVALLVSQFFLETDGYAMMDAKNLRTLPFFGKVGAFGVDLDDPSDGARAILYAARLLRSPRALVWIFPQGRERPVTARPLGFRGGSAEVARVARRARVLPIGIRYEFGGAERPILYLSFGAPVCAEGGADLVLQRHEAAVTAELERIDAALASGDLAAFEIALGGRKNWLFAMMQSALAWIARGKKIDTAVTHRALSRSNPPPST